jgi:hypothetical protein
LTGICNHVKEDGDGFEVKFIVEEGVFKPSPHPLPPRVRGRNEELGRTPPRFDGTGFGKREG